MDVNVAEDLILQKIAIAMLSAKNCKANWQKEKVELYEQSSPQ